jgi:hypothetical protein
MIFSLGDYAPGETVSFLWSSYNASGASVTRATNGTVSVYKDSSDTQTTTGVTDSEDVDALTGIHRATIATTDAFYTPGSVFFVVLSGATIDGQSVNAILATFTIGRTGVLARGTLSGTHSSTTADLGTSAPSQDVAGMTLIFPGHKQAFLIDSYSTSTGVATFSPATAVTLADGDVWYLVGTPKASTGAPPAVNVTQISGDTTAADNLEAAADGTGYNLGGGSVVAASVTGNVGGNVAGSVGSVTGAVGSVTGNVGGNVVGSIGSLAAQAKTDVNVEVNDVLNVDASSELAAVPAANASLGAKIRWLFVKARNKITQTATTQTVFADDGSTTVATSTVSDNGTTATRGEFA